MNECEFEFMQAYGKCISMASDNDIKYYFENAYKAQLGTAKEQRYIRDGNEYWGHIEDCWLLWNSAIYYSKKEIK